MMGILSLIGGYTFPVLLLGVPLYAALRGIPAYDTFVLGAEEGIRLAVRTLPYLIAIFAAIGCLRGSGALDWFSKIAGKVLGGLGIPAEVVPLILIRPISGSGALALTADLLETHGPDSPLGLLASILQGATDTTFYVATLYFGSVGVKRTRNVVLSCLVGDACGFITGFLLWRLLFSR